MYKNSKLLGSIIGVLLFILLVAGFTYAWITYRGEAINTAGSSKCFNILYTKGNDISGTIFPSSNYAGGLSTTVKMNMDSSCDIDATGKIVLNTDNTTSSNLLEERNGNYVLKYQVLINGLASSALKGSITSTDPIEINVGTLNKSASAITEYTVYVWADGEYVNNDDLESIYSGSITAKAIQVGDY